MSPNNNEQHNLSAKKANQQGKIIHLYKKHHTTNVNVWEIKRYKKELYAASYRNEIKRPIGRT